VKQLTIVRGSAFVISRKMLLRFIIVKRILARSGKEVTHRSQPQRRGTPKDYDDKKSFFDI